MAEKRKKEKGLVVLVTLSILLAVQVCLANPVAFPWPDNPRGVPQQGVQDGTWLPKVLIVVGFDCVVDFVVILCAYFCMEKAKIIKSWRFLAYFVLVVIGGFLIDEVVVWFSGQDILFGSSGSTDRLARMVVLFPVALFLLALYNYKLPRHFFGLTTLQAVTIGIAMGIFTNPLLYEQPKNRVMDWYYAKETRDVMYFPQDWKWHFGGAYLDINSPSLNLLPNTMPKVSGQETVKEYLPFAQEDLHTIPNVIPDRSTKKEYPFLENRILYRNIGNMSLATETGDEDSS